MMFLVCLFILVSVGSPQETLGPVEKLDYDKLLGRYYHVYMSEQHRVKMFNNSYCSSIDFSEVNDTTIEFQVARRMESVDGDFSYRNGLLAFSGVGGKFLYSSRSQPDRVMEGWIVKLGPPEFGEDKLYSYFIAAAPALQPYIVAVRDLGDFKLKYDNGVRNWLDAKGFTERVSAKQPEQCVFEGEED